MGLGNLNPGCGCSCGTVFQPTNECQESGLYWRPISVSVTTPVFGGLPLHNCGFTFWPTCGRLSPNPGRVTTPFLTVQDPQFNCMAVARSFANYGTNPGQINCYGLWKIYDGNPQVFFVNSLGWNTLTPPFQASATGYVGKTFIAYPYRYFYAITVAVSARLLMSNVVGPEIGAWVSGQTSGVNWYRSSYNVSRGTHRVVAQFRSTDGSSVFEVDYSPALFSSNGYSPPWCNFASWSSLFISSSTSLVVYEDDPPSERAIRHIDIWTPDPALDLLGLTTGATGYILLGRQ